MRRSLVAAFVVLATIFAVVVSGTLPRGFAQVAGPQGDEFNNNVFAAPFTPKCGQFASPTCPDGQSPATWSLNSASPGQLRIMTLPGSLVGTAAQGANNARNLILQPYNPLVDWQVTIKMSFPATNVNVNALGQTAGILAYQDDDNFLYIGRSFVSVNGTPQSQIQFLQESGGVDAVGSLTETGVIPPTIYLRLVKTGSTYTAYYSTDNFVTSNVQIPAGSLPSTAPTATLTPTGTATATPAPTVTGTPTPTSYTASYASPQVGVFAWGGTNSAVVSSELPADFDWFRVGNSMTPAPTALPTATGTPAVTATATAAATATATATAAATATSTPAPTATATTAPTPTNTPVPTPTPTRPRPRRVAAFSYSSVWYHFIRVGTVQHLQVQAKSHATQGIWAVVYFATGKQIHFYQNTDSKGFWQTTFRVPGGTIARTSPTAVVTFQLWFSTSTVKDWQTFNVVP